MFVVPRGELEDWLPSLGVPGKKTDWTVAMLERLGSDPADPDYVQQTSGDVWDFIRDIVVGYGTQRGKGLSSCLGRS